MSRVSSNLRNVAVLGALLLGATTGGSAAQEGDAPAGTPSRRAAPTSAEQVATARSAVQRGSVLAQRISAMLEEARREADIIRVTCLNDKLTQVNANMRTAQTRMSAMLEEARREADIIRVTCLNDKLTQVNANMRTAQTRMSAFESASDPETRNHEATVLGVLGQKFQVLDQEANRCVGQDIYDTGSTKVQTEIDTALLPYEEDVSIPTPPPPSAIPELPPFSSGTK